MTGKIIFWVIAGIGLVIFSLACVFTKPKDPSELIAEEPDMLVYDPD